MRAAFKIAWRRLSGLASATFNVKSFVERICKAKPASRLNVTGTSHSATTASKAWL